MKEKESRNRNLKRISEQSLELVSVFRKASRYFIFIFLYKAYKNLNTICKCTETTDLQLEALKNIFICWSNPFKK